MRLETGVHEFPAPGDKARRLVCYVAVTEDEKVVAGGAIWLRENHPSPGFAGGKIPYLLSFYTDPQYRGRGLATLIVKEAMKWARERGYPWMTLHASPMGRGIYEKLGWRARQRCGTNSATGGEERLQGLMLTVNDSGSQFGL